MTETAAHQLVWAGAWPEQSSVTDHRNFELDCALDRKPVESNQNRCHMRRSCTLGPLVNELSRYCAQKKKNQIREKLETDFCIGTSAPAGIWVQDICSDGVCCLLVFTRNTFVLMKWDLGARTTGEQHSAYACFSTAYNNPLPPLVEKQTASFLLVPPERGGMRYFITQIRMRTEAPLQERRGGRVLLVKYGLVLVKLVWLIHCWGAGAEPVSLHLAGLLFPRCAARQDEWTPTCRGVESTSSITVCAFWLLLCNFVCMQRRGGGVFWSVFEAGFWPLHRIFMTHLFACMHGLRSGPNYFWGQQKHFFLHSSF